MPFVKTILDVVNLNIDCLHSTDSLLVFFDQLTSIMQVVMNEKFRFREAT